MVQFSVSACEPGWGGHSRESSLFLFPGSLCADVGAEETREDSKMREFVIVESEPGDTGCESESDANVSLYTPTPVRRGKAHPIDLPNKLGFIALAQLGRNVERVPGLQNPWL